MRVEVTYFAMLREQAGVAEETVQCREGDAAQLYAQLRDSHGFSLERSRLRVAVNDAFADWDAPLRDGDRVAFIPPVSGG